jgi:hypothetical protein
MPPLRCAMNEAAVNVWIDTLKRGPMVRHIQGIGTPVPKTLSGFRRSSAGKVNKILAESSRVTAWRLLMAANPPVTRKLTACARRRIAGMFVWRSLSTIRSFWLFLRLLRLETGKSPWMFLLAPFRPSNMRFQVVVELSGIFVSGFRVASMISSFQLVAVCRFMMRPSTLALSRAIDTLVPDAAGTFLRNPQHSPDACACGAYAPSGRFPSTH